jgi:hypothetical protein
MADKKQASGIPPRYVEALGNEDPIEVMATSPDIIRRVIAGLDEKQLATKPAPGKWSIKEIIGHLADGEVILGSRFRMIGAHDKPPIAGYDQDAFVANLGVANAKALDLLDDFAMARAVNLGLLERLPEDGWKRVGLHAERGEESIAKLVMMYAGHDRNHIEQIETIRVGLFPKAKRARRPAKKTRATAGKKEKVAKVAKKAPAKKSARGKAR